MVLAREGMTNDVYQLLRRLSRFRYPISMALLPFSGIYFFFEEGETGDWGGQEVARVVRIGTHRRDGRFRNRIRQHYGAVRSFGGNKNGSVFRMHLGAALLRKQNMGDPRLEEWLRHMGQSAPEVEIQVSRLLREKFSFCCLPVDDQKERMDLERSLIGLFVRTPLGPPSEDWLGHHAAPDKIRRSGLWNTQHIEAEPLNPSGLIRLEQIAKSMFSNR